MYPRKPKLNAVPTQFPSTGSSEDWWPLQIHWLPTRGSWSDLNQLHLNIWLVQILQNMWPHEHITWSLTRVLEDTHTNEGPHLNLRFISIVVNLSLVGAIMVVVNTSLFFPSSCSLAPPRIPMLSTQHTAGLTWYAQPTRDNHYSTHLDYTLNGFLFEVGPIFFNRKI